MKPLSIISYIKGNYKKILPLTITVCLASALLYFLIILESGLVTLNEDVNLSYLSNMSLIYGGEKGVSKDDVGLLNHNQDSQKWIVTNTRSANYKAVSRSRSFLFLLKETDILQFMNSQNWMLIKGSLPQKDGEVILSRKLAANNHLQVGSVVRKETEGWNIDKDVTVVGIFDGAAVLGIGYGNEELLKLGEKGASIIVLSNKVNSKSMNRYIEEQFGKEYELFTWARARITMDQIISSFNAAVILIGIIVIITMGVLLGNICMIQYTQRSKEFELLHAIGYTKKFIVLKIWKEIGSSSILGYLLGILLAIFVGWLVDVCSFRERAIDITLLQMDRILIILFIPAFVTIFGMITPVKLIQFK